MEMKPGTFWPQVRQQTGFTLIEMVMVIVILGILSIGTSRFIDVAVSGYVDTNNRNKMASAMVVASEKLSREIRRALPNSVRIGGDTASKDNCLELIPIIAGSRYVSVPLTSAAGSFEAVSLGQTSPISAFIAVYPININDLYTPTDVTPGSMTGTRATIPTGGGQINVTLGANHRFKKNSPTRRFFAVDEPIAYCQPSGSNRIYRYTNYGFNSAVSLPPSGATRDLLIDEASRSSPIVFNYASSTRTRNAVVSFELTTNINGENLALAQEVQIRNVP